MGCTMCRPCLLLPLLQASALLSLQFQLRQLCHSLQERGVQVACEAIFCASRFAGESWGRFQVRLAGGEVVTRCRGVPLHNMSLCHRVTLPPPTLSFVGRFMKLSLPLVCIHVSHGHCVTVSLSTVCSCHQFKS